MKILWVDDKINHDDNLKLCVSQLARQLSKIDIHLEIDEFIDLNDAYTEIDQNSVSYQFAIVDLNFERDSFRKEAKVSGIIDLLERRRGLLCYIFTFY